MKNIAYNYLEGGNKMQSHLRGFCTELREVDAAKNTRTTHFELLSLCLSIFSTFLGEFLAIAYQSCLFVNKRNSLSHTEKGFLIFSSF